MIHLTHTVSLHDMCDDLPDELCDEIMKLTCDREVEITVKVLNAQEYETDTDADDTAWKIISDLVLGGDQLPITTILQFGDQIRVDLYRNIKADIQKYMNEKLPREIEDDARRSEDC